MSVTHTFIAEVRNYQNHHWEVGRAALLLISFIRHSVLCVPKQCCTTPAARFPERRSSSAPENLILAPHAIRNPLKSTSCLPDHNACPHLIGEAVAACKG